MAGQLALRWTVGDVSRRGFQALGLSVQSAKKIFGSDALYAVCINTLGVERVRLRLGSIADQVTWYQAEARTPAWISRHLDSAYAEGVAWKLAPVRLFPQCYELALDNDVILWDLPPSIMDWLADGDSCLIAEDVATSFGKFADLCGSEPRNSGIRGLPPGLDFENEIREILNLHDVVMTSELDEQGLQVAAVLRNKHRVISVDDVTICGAFPPHLRHLGNCGAHFVGVNAKTLPWEYLGRSGEQYIHENWDDHLPEVIARVRSARPARLCLPVD